MVIDIFGVYLGNDQRHFGVHAEVSAFVDYGCTRLDGPGYKLGRHLIWRTGDDHVDACKRVGTEQFNGDISASYGNYLSRRTAR